MTYIVHVTGPAGRDWFYMRARNEKSAEKKATKQGHRVILVEQEESNGNR